MNGMRADPGRIRRLIRWWSGGHHRRRAGIKPMQTELSRRIEVMEDAVWSCAITMVVSYKELAIF
jgi:hypothetical protein